jgi:prepilin-type N-terminal cleavage/methylation domain-containing protein
MGSRIAKNGRILASESGLLFKGFTLIELLIVVAIIAILAAIAVPNFLEAQTRSKVSRVRADLRTIATGLEAYVVDSTAYPPNDGVFNVVPIELTTPVAYLTNSLLVDPFSNQLRDRVYGDLARFYTYDLILNQQEFLALVSAGGRRPPVEAVDSPAFNVGAIGKYGKWRLVSNGPDRSYRDPQYVFGSDPLDPNGVLLGSDVRYDATNGTTSKGNILRTQKTME